MLDPRNIVLAVDELCDLEVPIEKAVTTVADSYHVDRDEVARIWSDNESRSFDHLITSV